MLCFLLLQAFPIGSPLVPDVSRAILEVTEGEKMGEIEKAWIGLKKSCSDSSPSVSSNSLSLESFWGLFLITGIASFSALTVYLSIFIYEHRDVLRRLDPQASTWRKLVVLSSQFNQKDLDSHIFRKAEQYDKSCLNDMDRMRAEASPQGNYSTAPSTFFHFRPLHILIVRQVHHPFQTFPSFREIKEILHGSMVNRIQMNK